MRVIVTRPEPGCSRTVAVLGQRNHEAIMMPLTRVVDLLSGGEGLNEIPAWATAVTSANAVRAWRALGIGAVARARPLYAVGERTAQTARDAGFENVRTGDGDGTSLAARILRDLASGAAGNPTAPLLYAAGRTRHAHFETALSAQNVPYQLVELYDIVEISYSTDFIMEVFRKKEPVAVLLYSRKAAELFFSIFPPELSAKLLKNNKYLCLSENVANAIPRHFRDRAFAAAHPDEVNLLSLLERGSQLS